MRDHRAMPTIPRNIGHIGRRVGRFGLFKSGIPLNGDFLLLTCQHAIARIGLSAASFPLITIGINGVYFGVLITHEF